MPWLLFADATTSIDVVSDGVESLFSRESLQQRKLDWAGFKHISVRQRTSNNSSPISLNTWEFYAIFQESRDAGITARYSQDHGCSAASFAQFSPTVMPDLSEVFGQLWTTRGVTHGL